MSISLDPPPQLPPLPAHSGVGIASFVISLIAALCLAAVVVIAGILETSLSQGQREEAGVYLIVGRLVLLFLRLSFVALWLGIAGLLQYHRNRVFAVLGTSISALAMVGTVGLMILGWTSSG